MEYSGKMEPVATKILLTKLQKKKVGIRILTPTGAARLSGSCGTSTLAGVREG